MIAISFCLWQWVREGSRGGQRMERVCSAIGGCGGRFRFACFTRRKMAGGDHRQHREGVRGEIAAGLSVKFPEPPLNFPGSSRKLLDNAATHGLTRTSEGHWGAREGGPTCG